MQKYKIINKTECKVGVKYIVLNANTETFTLLKLTPNVAPKYKYFETVRPSYYIFPYANCGEENAEIGKITVYENTEKLGKEEIEKRIEQCALPTQRIREFYVQNFLSYSNDEQIYELAGRLRLRQLFSKDLYRSIYKCLKVNVLDETEIVMTHRCVAFLASEENIDLVCESVERLLQQRNTDCNEMEK